MHKNIFVHIPFIDILHNVYYNINVKYTIVPIKVIYDTRSAFKAFGFAGNNIKLFKNSFMKGAE